MRNASPRTTLAATTAPSSESIGPMPPGPSSGAWPPALVPKSFMSVSVSGDVLLDSRPPPAPKGGEPMQGNNSPVNKRTVRPRRSARRHGRPQPRRVRRPRSPFFRRGFPDCAVARIRPCREVNDVDIPSFARTIRTRSRRLSSFIGLDRSLAMRLVAAPEGSA